MDNFKKILSYSVFWFIQLTWGIIMNFIGAATALVLIIAGKKPQTAGPVVYIKTGHNWGGITLGAFVFLCENSNDSILYHECGHTIQNIYWGPLFPFVIGFPSLIRCMIRQRETHLEKSLFNLFLLLITLFITTILACITGPILPGLKGLTIFIEVLRLYFLTISIWLGLVEITKYNHGFVDYDEIWFEGQASKWGNKIFNK